MLLLVLHIKSAIPINELNQSITHVLTARGPPISYPTELNQVERSYYHLSVRHRILKNLALTRGAHKLVKSADIFLQIGTPFCICETFLRNLTFARFLILLCFVRPLRGFWSYSVLWDLYEVFDLSLFCETFARLLILLCFVRPLRGFWSLSVLWDLCEVFDLTLFFETFARFLILLCFVRPLRGFWSYSVFWDLFEVFDLTLFFETFARFLILLCFVRPLQDFRSYCVLWHLSLFFETLVCFMRPLFAYWDLSLFFETLFQNLTLLTVMAFHNIHLKKVYHPSLRYI
jgi:hypothetical protein